jgi:hypothetical protein
LTARNALIIVEEKSIKSPEMPHQDPAAWVLSGEFDAMKHCVRCNGGLATILGMAKMRCTVLLSPFDHTQLPFVEEKLLKTSEEPPQSSGVGASR